MTITPSQSQGDGAEVTTPASTTEWPGGRFLPPPEPREGADGSKRYEGVTYAAPEGYRPLQLDVWVPASAVPPPLVVWIHGGAWLFGDRRYLPETLRPNQLFEELINAGLAVATIDYRHPWRRSSQPSCTTRRPPSATFARTRMCWVSTPAGSESGASPPAVTWLP